MSERPRPFLARSDNIMQALVDAGVITADPRTVSRVVIDLQAGSVAMIYLATFADRKLIDVVLEGGLRVDVGEDEADGEDEAE